MASWPALERPSTPGLLARNKGVDRRHKAGDEAGNPGSVLTAVTSASVIEVEDIHQSSIAGLLIGTHELAAVATGSDRLSPRPLRIVGGFRFATMDFTSELCSASVLLACPPVA